MTSIHSPDLTETPHRQEANQSETQVRISLQAQCSIYSEAKLKATQAMAVHPHVWLEAHPPRQDPNLRLAKPDSISYAVHGSSKASDVPPFAIEVYEHGALSQYEVSRDRILTLSTMSESERQTTLRAAKLRAQLTDAQEPASLSAPGWSRPRL